MVAVVGDLNLDIIVFFDKIPEYDEEKEVNKIITSGGGVGGNISYTLAKLGSPVSLISTVGNDIIGKSLLKELVEQGVNTDYINILPNEKTGVCIALVEKNKDRRLLTFRGANKKLNLSKIISTNFKKQGWIHISGHNPEIVKEIIDNVHKKIISYDPGSIVLNKINLNLFISVLKEIDFLFLNKIEYKTIKEKLSDSFKKKIKNLIIKKGEDGVDYYENGALKYQFPSFKTNVVDTTGAGDVFDAAFIHAIKTEKFNVKISLIFASAAAALSIKGLGVRTSVPNRQEIIDFANLGRVDNKWMRKKRKF